MRERPGSAPMFSLYDHDDPLLQAVRDSGRARVRVYRLKQVTVVLGRGTKADQELDLGACRADGVALRRRHGGGCAVVIDPGNVIVSCVLAAQGIGDNKRYMRHLSDWLIAGLQEVGVRGLKRAGVSDLVQNERKVSGSCIYRPRGLLYYSASLLVEADLSLMPRYLRHPPREPDYRQSRPHEAFVRNLRVPGAAGSAAADLERALGRRLIPPELLAG